VQLQQAWVNGVGPRTGEAAGAGRVALTGRVEPVRLSPRRRTRPPPCCRTPTARSTCSPTGSDSRSVDPTRTRAEYSLALPVHWTRRSNDDGLLEQFRTDAVPPAGTAGGSFVGGTGASRSGTGDLDDGLARQFEVLGDCAGRDLAELGDCIVSALPPDGGAADDVAWKAISRTPRTTRSQDAPGPPSCPERACSLLDASGPGTRRRRGHPTAEHVSL
jgi:hypothetical protein